MSELTASLMGRPRSKRRHSPWTGRLALVTDELVKAHGTPRLGNYRDPVREIFYILLSARTTDSQYRRTYHAPMRRVLPLTDIAKAQTDAIMAQFVTGKVVASRS